MEYAIHLLENHKKDIDRTIKSSNLMQRDMTKASRELSKVSDLKRAIKILKTKRNK